MYRLYNGTGAKFTTKQIREFVENNPKLVTRKESVRYPGLYVLKYTRRVFYDALWNVGDGILTELRGRIVDEDYNTMVAPFKKIYNRGENGTDFPLDADVTYVEKINGFMGAKTHNNLRNEIIYSTTGSTDSPFAAMVEKHLNAFVPEMGWTWLFEICDPEDPHIVYEYPGAYLIGARNLYTGEMKSEEDLDYYAKRQGFPRPEWGTGKFSEVVANVKKARFEGYVVYGKCDVVGGDNALKIKSPYYLTKKLFARIGKERLCSSWLLDCKKTIDEEYYPLIDYVNEHRIQFSAMPEQERLLFMENFLNGITNAIETFFDRV